MARDKYGQLVFLADSAFTIAMTQEKFPDVKLHFISEFIKYIDTENFNISCEVDENQSFPRFFNTY